MRSRGSLVVGAVLGVCVVLAGVAVWIAVAHLGGGGHAQASAPSASAGTVQCQYPTEGLTSSKFVGVPDTSAPDTGTALVTLNTNQGDISLALDRAKAPCAVQSFDFLAGKNFFSNTACDQMYNSLHDGLLKCGDPTGTGRWMGGPGYNFQGKPATGLKPAPITGQVIYPSGTVAMTLDPLSGGNGSRFVMFFRDTWYSTGLTVIGRYSVSSQTTLDRIAAGGVQQYTMPGTSMTACRPVNPVTILRTS